MFEIIKLFDNVLLNYVLGLHFMIYVEIECRLEATIVHNLMPELASKTPALVQEDTNEMTKTQTYNRERGYCCIRAYLSSIQHKNLTPFTLVANSSPITSTTLV